MYIATKYYYVYLKFLRTVYLKFIDTKTLFSCTISDFYNLTLFVLLLIYL